MEPPANLSERQRTALSEFSNGHISAAELSERVRAQSDNAADNRPPAAPAGPRAGDTRRFSALGSARAAKRGALLAAALVLGLAGAGVAVLVGSGPAASGGQARRGLILAPRQRRHVSRRGSSAHRSATGARAVAVGLASAPPRHPVPPRASTGKTAPAPRPKN